MVSNSVKNNGVPSERILEYLENINSLVNNVFGESSEWLSRRSELIQIIDNIQKGKKSKKEKKRKDVNAPKKNLSSYLHFCARNRDAVKEIIINSLPDANSFDNKDVLKKLGNDWQVLEDKDVYTKLAFDDKARYEDEMSRYVSTLSSENDSSSSLKKPKSSIKKPKSGWMFYCIATREEVKNVLTEETGDKPSFSDISKRLSEMWKELNEVDKSEFNELSSNDKERYRRETESTSTEVDNEVIVVIEDEEGGSVQEKSKHRAIKKNSKK